MQTLCGEVDVRQGNSITDTGGAGDTLAKQISLQPGRGEHGVRGSDYCIRRPTVILKPLPTIASFPCVDQASGDQLPNAEPPD